MEPRCSGDAALRAGAPQLALRFVEGREGDEGLARIAAVARAEIPGPQRPEALCELERLALGGGVEAELAAIARLMLCLPPVLADWHEEVARGAESGEHSRLVESLRVMVLSRSDPAGALELAQALPREAWAAEVRLRVAGSAEDHEAMRSAAEEFLVFGPDPSGRLLASQALAQAGEIQRASEITASISEDPNTPPQVRNDAFHVRMKTLADLGRWPEAAAVWENWARLSFRELRPADDRISAWHVRVASNRRRSAGGCI